MVAELQPIRRCHLFDTAGRSTRDPLPLLGSNGCDTVEERHTHQASFERDGTRLGADAYLKTRRASASLTPWRRGADDVFLTKCRADSMRSARQLATLFIESSRSVSAPDSH